LAPDHIQIPNCRSARVKRFHSVSLSLSQSPEDLSVQVLPLHFTHRSTSFHFVISHTSVAHLYLLTYFAGVREPAVCSEALRPTGRRKFKPSNADNKTGQILIASKWQVNAARTTSRRRIFAVTIGRRRTATGSKMRG